MKKQNDLAKIVEAPLQELVELYDNIRHQEVELASSKKVIGDEILSRIKVDGEVVGKFMVGKRTLYKFTMTIDEARELGATKTEEKINTEMAKSLYLKGVKLPGEVIISVFPNIREIQKKKKL